MQNWKCRPESCLRWNISVTWTLQKMPTSLKQNWVKCTECKLKSAKGDEMIVINISSIKLESWELQLHVLHLLLNSRDLLRWYNRAHSISRHLYIISKIHAIWKYMYANVQYVRIAVYTYIPDIMSPNIMTTNYQIPLYSDILYILYICKIYGHTF